MQAAEGSFRYKFGLSFPGELRDEKVHQLADLLCVNCDGDEDRVLYDLYQQGANARPGLDEYLPGEYTKCELVIIFLCKEYALKNWCRKEWLVVQRLARDSELRHRVMYLWFGDLEDAVLGELGLDWNTDGFKRIDNLEPRAILDLVIQRYKRNAQDLAVDHSLSTSPLRLNLAPADALQADACWRLLVVVSGVDGDDPTASCHRFRAAAWLLGPDGRAVSSSDLHRFTTDDALPLDQLAAQIPVLYSVASSLAVGQLSGSEASVEVLLVLVLPAAVISSDRLQWLLQMVHNSCQPDLDAPDEEESALPPIVVACAERLNADLFAGFGEPTTLKTARAWLDANTKAQQISKEIISCCACGAGSLHGLNWWLLHEDPEVARAQPSYLPKLFVEREGCVRPAKTLDDRRVPFRVGQPARNRAHEPQSLYLRWQDNLHQSQPDNYRWRMMRILRSGVPLFLIESSQRQAADDHPLDAILQWSHPDLIGQYCYFHRTLDPPADDAEKALWDYLRQSILFCDDHRFRPPRGASQSSSAAQIRSDALNSPIQ
jgi:hypothetical protein